MTCSTLSAIIATRLVAKYARKSECLRAANASRRGAATAVSAPSLRRSPASCDDGADHDQDDGAGDEDLERAARHVGVDAEELFDPVHEETSPSASGMTPILASADVTGAAIPTAAARGLAAAAA